MSNEQDSSEVTPDQPSKLARAWVSTLTLRDDNGVPTHDELARDLDALLDRARREGYDAAHTLSPEAGAALMAIATPAGQSETCPIAGFTDPPKPCTFARDHKGPCSFTAAQRVNEAPPAYNPLGPPPPTVHRLIFEETCKDLHSMTAQRDALRDDLRRCQLDCKTYEDLARTAQAKLDALRVDKVTAATSDWERAHKFMAGFPEGTQFDQAMLATLVSEIRAERSDYAKYATDEAAIPFATYVVDFFNSRNGAQLSPALGALTPEEHDLLIRELARILRFGGPPPNWVRRGEGSHDLRIDSAKDGSNG